MNTSNIATQKKKHLNERAALVEQYLRVFYPKQIEEALCYAEAEMEFQRNSINNEGIFENFATYEDIVKYLEGDLEEVVLNDANAEPPNDFLEDLLFNTIVSPITEPPIDLEQALIKDVVLPTVEPPIDLEEGLKNDVVLPTVEPSLQVEHAPDLPNEQEANINLFEHLQDEIINNISLFEDLNVLFSNDNAFF